MNVPFDKLNPDSRIWIYQSNRKFTEKEKIFILDKTEQFLHEWTAHGHNLQAGVKIFYDQFIVIGVNEAVNEASGCSIDKSFDFIRSLGKALDLNLLERSKVALKNQTEIDLVNFSEIKRMIDKGVITPESNVFNNAIVTKNELDNKWVQPVKESWMKRYFN